jgi:hypothetical protein
VLIDPQVLDTLPPRELRAGYAEVVKYGLIDDFAFFEWCEANAARLARRRSAAREHAISHSVAAKARIVGEDERETTGKRALAQSRPHLRPRARGRDRLLRQAAPRRRRRRRHGAGLRLFGARASARARKPSASPRISARSACPTA